MTTIDHTKVSISDLLKGDLQLASPPTIYFELKKVTDDPTKTLNDAGEIIEKDPGLSARLLKIVNSAFFGFPTKISTLSHAISMIGVGELENLVLATLVVDKFSSMPSGLISMRDFWSMSLRCALNAKELCGYNSEFEIPEAVFVCGLLHDIGRLIFYRRIPKIAREIGLQKASSKKDEVEIEQNLLGFDHYQTGAELAKLWNLPDIIEATIRHHNNPELAGQFSHKANIVKLAYQLSQQKNFDPDNFIIDSKLSTISISDLEIITQKVNTEFDKIFSLFYSDH
jgi:HD-like signal output (HDOD) protein